MRFTVKPFLFALTFMSCISCRTRMIDGLSIGKNPLGTIDLTGVETKEVRGDSYHPYLITHNYEDAVSEAFASAGADYDLLLDVKIDVKYYPFIIYFSSYVIVEAKAVNSSKLRASLGEAQFTKLMSNRAAVFTKD